MRHRPSRLKWIAPACALACVAASPPADAHPHVFVVAKEQILFAPDGKVSGVRAAWTFDDMYSSFLVQGIGTPGDILTEEQLAPLAKTNVELLAEFGYFTVAKAAGKALEFAEPVDYRLKEGADKLVTLSLHPAAEAAGAPAAGVHAQRLRPDLFRVVRTGRQGPGRSRFAHLRAARRASPSPSRSMQPTTRNCPKPSSATCRPEPTSASSWPAGRSSPAHDGKVAHAASPPVPRSWRPCCSPRRPGRRPTTRSGSASRKAGAAPAG